MDRGRPAAPEVPYILQKMWDTRVEKPSVILTGSVVGMVKRLVAEAGSPLFGRANLVLEPGELEPPAVFQWLADMGVVGEEAFKLFLLFGGVLVLCQVVPSSLLSIPNLYFWN
jgi:hypothetical protein